MADQKVIAWQVEDTGLENSQYHQGYGTAFTQWDAVMMGCGDNFEDAFEDAIQQACCSGYSLEISEEEFAKEVASASEDIVTDDDFDNDCHYYVGLYLKTE
jgi:hypothetical protein